jgi:hypothetical protein
MMTVYVRDPIRPFSRTIGKQHLVSASSIRRDDDTLFVETDHGPVGIPITNVLAWTWRLAPEPTQGELFDKEEV